MHLEAQENASVVVWNQPLACCLDVACHRLLSEDYRFGSRIADVLLLLCSIKLAMPQHEDRTQLSLFNSIDAEHHQTATSTTTTQSAPRSNLEQEIVNLIRLYGQPAIASAREESWAINQDGTSTVMKTEHNHGISI